VCSSDLTTTVDQQNSSTPTVQEATPETLPTSEQMTISSNGTTMVILANRKGTLATGGSKDLGAFSIPSGVEAVMIYFTWDSGSLDGVVTKPDGSPVDTHSKDVQVMTSNNMSGYTVMNPVAGNWNFSIKNVKTTKDKLTYNFMVQYTLKNNQP
jgi:hypothetical protein